MPFLPQDFLWGCVSLSFSLLLLVIFGGSPVALRARKEDENGIEWSVISRAKVGILLVHQVRVGSRSGCVQKKRMLPPARDEHAEEICPSYSHLALIMIV